MRRRSPREKVYLRNYPIDYLLYKRDKDFKYIHPNKLKTWLAFAKATRKAREKSFEDVIDSVIDEMKGKKFKVEERRVVELPKSEIVKLKIEAMRKGINPKWVDILARSIEEIEGEEVKKEVSRVYIPR